MSPDCLVPFIHRCSSCLPTAGADIVIVDRRRRDSSRDSAQPWDRDGRHTTFGGVTLLLRQEAAEEKKICTSRSGKQEEAPLAAAFEGDSRHKVSTAGAQNGRIGGFDYPQEI